MAKKSARRRGDHRVRDLSGMGPREAIQNRKYEEIYQAPFPPPEDFVFERKSSARRRWEKERS